MPTKARLNDQIPLSIPTAAARATVSVQTITNAVQRGELPAVDISAGDAQRRHYRIAPTDLDKWLKAHRGRKNGRK